MAQIALKVDVDTLRGTLEGVPRLLGVLARRDLRATFLFSLGPDHTGWALRRVFRRGFLSKVSRTSVLRHYGLGTLSCGVLRPGPDIGRRGAAAMRACRDAGHECGIHAWDHVVWHDTVRRRDATWTRAAMTRAHDRFGDVFGAPPATHGAAGWQMNDAAFAQVDDWGMDHASDGRGIGPFRPIVGGRTLRHVQLPTTLPTFDELIGLDGIDERDVGQRLAAATPASAGQVFTLHAELEGGLLAPAFEDLLDRWRDLGHQPATLAAVRKGLDPASLPAIAVRWGEVPGRSGELVTDGRGAAAVGAPAAA